MRRHDILSSSHTVKPTAPRASERRRRTLASGRRRGKADVVATTVSPTCSLCQNHAFLLADAARRAPTPSAWKQLLIRKRATAKRRYHPRPRAQRRV